MNILKQEGTSRAERSDAALDPARVSIDDRTLEDFIIYAQQFSKNILFVDTNAETLDLNHGWDTFFKDDLVLLSAYIATQDAEEMKSAYDLLFDRFQRDGKVENLRQMVNYVFERFDKFSQWYYSSKEGSALHQELYMYIRAYLANDLKRLEKIIEYLNTVNKNNNNWELIQNNLADQQLVWQINEKQAISIGENMFSGSTDTEKLTSAVAFIGKIFDTILHSVAGIIASARNYFAKVIFQQQDLSPHISLYIAFIRLLGIQQKELNRVPARILDFYYRDVLRIKEKPPVPDETFVVFDITKGFDSYIVPKGTKLLAGKDKKKADLVYATDKEIVVNRAKLRAVRNIFIERNEKLISNYFARTIKQNNEFIVPGTGEVGYTWPAFGTTETIPAKTGIAIASTQLYLAKAERIITVMFETDQDLTINSFDPGLIELSLTGEKGWVGSHKPDGTTEDTIKVIHFMKINRKSLELKFRISIAQASAIVAFDPLIHSGFFTITLPILQILLRFPAKTDTGNTEALVQLNFLLSLSLKYTAIDVEVGTIDLLKTNFDGIRDLDIENHDSVLDSKKPFYPFTSMPKVGSSFYVGNSDLYYKKINSLALNIEWMLPDNFRTHYDKYFPPYDSNEFMASLNILKDQYWNKIDDYTIIEKNSNDTNFRVIKVDNPASANDNAPVLSKSDTSRRNGTLKLKLNYPDFGHDVYPQLITSVMMDKAREGNVDFYKVLKKELRDETISIKLPLVTDQGYAGRDVTQSANSDKAEDNIKNEITRTLTMSLTGFNGVSAQSREIRQLSIQQTRTLVNDDNFVSKVLGFLKKIKLINRNVYFDKNNQSVEDVVESVNEEMLRKIDFILPADHEMISIIMSEVNNAIERVVGKVIGKILTERKKSRLNEQRVNEIIAKEVNDANEVINEMVARKITTLLSVNDIPPPPYTPLINAISLSYQSLKELNATDDHFYHILPFGCLEIFPTDAGRNEADITLFPRFLLPAKDGQPDPIGLLFAGFADVNANDNLSIYFQFDQGKRRSDRKPSEVRWWELTATGWNELTNDAVLADSTHGLQTTGIVELALSGNNNAISKNYFGEEALCWLAASVSSDIETFPELMDIQTQAVTAKFVDDDNDPAHLLSPLPAQKINKLVEELPGIKSVKQPVASFNGKIGEQSNEYYVRVSERLRHKSRAINNWDYERLVLENFPAVYKVKCLNNYYRGRSVPGHVTIVPIMSMKNRYFGEAQPELPKASFLQLDEIRALLEKKASVFSQLHVINPEPWYVTVNCKVRFKPGVEKGYHLKKLNQDLIRYLSPWVNETEAISFSTKIYASSVINFIDKLDYVDFVADLSLNQYMRTSEGKESEVQMSNNLKTLMETQIMNAHSILVSDSQHNIDLI